MKITGSVLFTIIICFNAFSQGVSNWRTYANMSDVRDIAVSEERISAATNGGAFLFNFSDGSYKTLNKSDGLTGISLTATAIDNSGRVWFGSSNGAIDIFDPADNSVKTIYDILRFDVVLKRINEIKITGDTAIVSTDYGISLINTNDYSFFETVQRFGTLSTNIKVNTSLKTNILYVSTDFGLAIQNSPTLSPESWNIFTANEGLPSNGINEIISYKNDILAATDAGIAILNGQTWVPFLNSLNNQVIVDLDSDGEILYILTPQAVYSYTSGDPVLVYESQALLTKLKISAQGIFAASNQGILKITGTTSADIILANGPAANKFPQITVDNDGALWSASGKNGEGVGFYKYENDNWINFNRANTPQLEINDVYTAFTASDNTIYLGTWGRGFIRVKDEAIDVFTRNNTGMNGTDENPDFLVVTSFGTDSRNNLWVLNYWATDRRSLSMMTPEGNWHHFIISAVGSQSYYGHYNLVVDQYDTKWFILQHPNRSGLFYFNENKTYTNSTDDRSGLINTGSGLNSNTINSLVIDRRGDLWVGTASGVNVITGLNSITSSPRFNINSVFALRQQNVNCMAVDPLNQKWIGTNQGVLLVNSDGSSLLASFNTRNSPILNDIVRSIAIDPGTGVVYVGTDDGLTSFQTLSINPQDSFSELLIYPSPFVLKASDNLLTIDGLIRDTEIKILSANGKLINEFESPGGYRAMWDGRDTEGKLVSSGIYLIVAYDKEGNNVTTGKIAVLRE